MTARVLAAILGLIPAYIASRKGRNFGQWWLYGFLIFIVALFHSLLLKPKQALVIEQAQETPVAPPPPQLPEGTKNCILCGQIIAETSSRCPVCKQDQSITQN